MILFFSFLSFVQILFLPGLIYCYLKKKFNLFFIISLSIFFNFILILLISLLKIYSFKLLLIIILFELLLIGFFFLKDKNNFKLYFNFNFFDIFSCIIIIFLSYKLLQYFYPFFGSLFSEGDVLQSWNEWALNLIGSTYKPGKLIIGSFDSDFIANQSRSYYGQLIPAIWSIFYLMTGNNDVTMFPKFLNFLLSCLGIIYLILDYFKSKKLLNLLLLIFIIVLFYKEHAHLVYSGLVDSSLSIFVFISLLSVFKFDDNFDENKLKTGILFAAIASNIKILTIYYSVIFLPIYLFFNYSNQLKKKIFLYIVICWCLCLFWPIYQYFIFDINIISNNNLDYLNSLSVKDYDEGLKRISGLFGSLKIFYLVIITLFISLFVKKINIITIFLIFPYVVIWYHFSSYDLRNVLIILPIISFVIAFVINNIFKKFNIKKNYSKKIFIKKKEFNVASLILILIFFSLFIKFNKNFDNYILDDISAKKLKIKNEEANKFIIEYTDNIEYIFTDYIYLKYILNERTTNKIEICYFFQKINLNHCKNEPNKKSILINYYNNKQIIDVINRNFSINKIFSNKNIKIYNFE